MNILFADTYLMIPHSEVQFGKDFGTFQLLKQLIYVGQWVLILYCLLVQRTIINTESIRTIFLLDKKNSAAPRRRTRSDKTETFLLIELFLQFFELFWTELIRPLAHWFSAGFEI